MRRAAEERLRTVSLWRAHLDLYCSVRGSQPRTWDLQPGRYRKARRLGGCYHAHCYTCHPSKIIGYPTRQEEEAWLRQREELLDLGSLQLADVSECGRGSSPGASVGAL